MASRRLRSAIADAEFEVRAISCRIHQRSIGPDRDLACKGLCVLANQTTTIARRVPEVRRFQQARELAKFFLRQLAMQLLGVAVI